MHCAVSGVTQMQRCPVVFGRTVRSGKDVPAIVEHLMNLTDIGSGGGEAESLPCETPAACHFGFTVYCAQPLEEIRFVVMIDNREHTTAKSIVAPILYWKSTKR